MQIGENYKKGRENLISVLGSWNELAIEQGLAEFKPFLTNEKQNIEDWGLVEKAEFKLQAAKFRGSMFCLQM